MYSISRGLEWEVNGQSAWFRVTLNLSAPSSSAPPPPTSSSSLAHSSPGCRLLRRRAAGAGDGARLGLGRLRGVGEDLQTWGWPRLEPACPRLAGGRLDGTADAFAALVADIAQRTPRAAATAAVEGLVEWWTKVSSSRCCGERFFGGRRTHLDSACCLLGCRTSDAGWDCWVTIRRGGMGLGGGGK